MRKTIRKFKHDEKKINKIILSLLEEKYGKIGYCNGFTVGETDIIAEIFVVGETEKQLLPFSYGEMENMRIKLNMEM